MPDNVFFIATLGCKINQYESHCLREAWTAQGWTEATDPARASLILVNSCAVTAKAVADVRNTVRRLHRQAPAAAILVTGCAAQVLEDELAGLPGVIAVCPQSSKPDLLHIRQELVKPDTWSSPPVDNPQAPPRPNSPTPQNVPFPAFALSGYDRSRAVLKVQDGCSHGCTYCIVPLTRGRAHTRDFADSLAEAQRLLAAGFREIVVSGVNLRQYRNAKHSDFWDFIRDMEEFLSPRWAGKARLRISSLEPGQLGAKALDCLAASRMLAPHLHLSLQSGSPSVLRRMGRGHYEPAAVPEFLRELAGHWPRFGLGADLIAGFPGESETEFEESLRLCDALPLSYAHVFPYSRRPGTRAAAMRGQLPQEVKKQRAARLRELAAAKKQVFLAELASMPQTAVVFEGHAEGGARGVNEFYADCRLAPGAERREAASGEIRLVQPVAANGEELLVDWG